MANYETGLDTKAKILDACKKLLYEKGFEKTTFKEISNLANVNQGLLVYHFNNKNNIVNSVFQDIMAELMTQIEHYFGEQELIIQYFISDFLYCRLIYEDAHFREFVKNCCERNILTKDSGSMSEAYIKVYQTGLDYMEEGFVKDVFFDEGLQAAYEGVKTSYSSYICKNYERLDAEYAATNYIAIYCHLLDVPRSVYGTKMLDALLLSNQVSLTVKDFELKMKKSHHSSVKVDGSH